MDLKKKQIFSITALVITVFIWGAGFVFSQIIVNSHLPTSMVNAIRFSVATLLIGLVFCKKIKFNKQVLLHGVFGGALLFCAFALQLDALNYTTPAYNGFFTASYILFVPFILWIVLKRKPTMFVIVGIVVALVGFFVLNFGGTGDGDITQSDIDIMIGNLMTIGSALFFAVQLVLSDYSLNKKNTPLFSFIFSQVMFTAIFSLLFFVCFELPTTDFATIEWNNAILPLCFVSILGTAFAYPCQTNAQLYVAPAETSLILSLEAVIGTVISVIVGFDIFNWHIAVGGLLVIFALLIVEVVPEYLIRRRFDKEIEKAKKQKP